MESYVARLGKGTGTGMANAQGDALLKSCRSLAVNWAQEQFDSYLKHLAQALLRGALDEVEEDDQILLFTHHKRIERAESRALTLFVEHLVAIMRGQQPAEESLSADFGEPALEHLNERVPKRLGRGALPLLQSITARAMTGACHACLRELQFKDKAESFAMGLFHEQFIPKLKQLYQALDEQLEAGADEQPQGLDAWISHIEQQLQDKAMSAASRSLALARLQRLRQQRDTQTANEQPAQPIHERWHNPYEDPEPERSYSDRELVAATGELFQPLFASDHIPRTLKALVGRLQPIVIDTALRDRALFMQPLHPARLLLNQLIATVDYWPQSSPEEQEVLLNTLRGLVERGLREFEGNATLFSLLSRDIDSYCQQYVQRIKLEQQRRHRQAQGAEKLASMREHVQQLLQKKLGQRAQPPQLLKLLMGPWSEVLVHQWLRHGSNSKALRDGIQLVEDLLWYIQPHPSWPDKKRARELGIELEQRLLSGFHLIEFDPRRGADLISGIHRLRALANRGRETVAGHRQLN